MKLILRPIVLGVFLCFNLVISQEELKLTVKDSMVTSSWMVGLGYNFVDESGDIYVKPLEVNNHLNAVAFPSRISIGRYFENGLGIELIGTYNKYKVGQNINGNPNPVESDYYGIDSRVSYDLNKIFGETGWFDPYVGVGLGYTDSDNTPKGTFNGVVGFRTWLSDHWGFDFSSSGKWRLGGVGTDHVQHAAGVVYRFGIKKELTKKGLQKAELKESIAKENQRKLDSIERINKKKEAEALAFQREAERKKQLAKEKEEERQREILARKEQVENDISNLGVVYFKFDSFTLTNDSKQVLDALISILENHKEVNLKINGHTDSRGTREYNQKLSETRANAVKDYLIGKGINDSRIESEGFGESQLLNDCDGSKPCTDAKHGINRRIESVVVFSD
ncbi:OmpA family protein [Tamlana fucoidanivorans]|uniref:OmpA family protein n=1 Tax=Allotamlana fucoidanivorans TaxID=2583814 RepID=A0A5C4SGI5_9FLAO|nr:OmpA family protein [Tamlana fucoidanivorans]TNJ42546.1 OmpA family protein [Tamlana fucoidanivorans]